MARPYGLAAPVWVLLISVLQGVFAILGVTSIFPFLAVASDPDGFRRSTIGELFPRWVSALPNEQLLLWFGIFSIGMLVASNVVNWVSDYVRARYAHNFGHWMRMRLLAQIALQPWRFFLVGDTSVMLKRTAWDVMQMIVGVVLPILEAIARAVSVVLLVGTLVVVDYRIALGSALVFGVYYGAVFLLLRQKASSLSSQRKEADRGAIREAQQLLTGIKAIKTSQAEAHFLQKFQEHSASQAKINRILPLFYNAPKYILEPIAFGLIVVLVIAYSSAGISIDALVPVLGVIGLAGYRLLPAAQILYAQLSQISTMRHTVDEVYEEFSRLGSDSVMKHESGLATPLLPLPWKKEISLNSVTFSYGDGDAPVLHDLSLEVAKRSSLGIVGKTGSGKSTLVDLILGLHKPTSGVIAVDGRPITDENLRSWQASIGYVPQDVFLIDDTVARNIALGVPDGEIDPARLRSVAEAAQILSFIENQLPEGFASMVGERGVRLSGGQRQRIALARALYRQPQLLILDEATSALDNDTEAAVVEAINRLQGSVTMIVVAHRLATVERCDRILDLDAPKVLQVTVDDDSRSE